MIKQKKDKAQLLAINEQEKPVIKVIKDSDQIIHNPPVFIVVQKWATITNLQFVP